MVNNLELREILTSTVTLYGATLFLQDDGRDVFKMIAFFIIGLINIGFYLSWIYCYFKAIEDKHPIFKDAAKSL